MLGISLYDLDGDSATERVGLLLGAGIPGVQESGGP